ncbi:glycosyltransferase family 4 protein [Rhodococcus pyridinivorans]|nr:glycosyltransferase family 4 protein [Rhodococcus pyridinivorans]
MKIAIVHSFYSSDQPSGENVVVQAQFHALSNAGHQVELVSKHTDEEQHQSGYKIRAALSAANIYGPSPTQELRTFSPDIIHIHNLFPNWGSDWMKEWSDRIVTTLHNYRPICAKGTLWREGHDCYECIDQSAYRAISHKCYRDSAIATLPLAYASRERGHHSPILLNSRQLIVLNDDAYRTYNSIGLPLKLSVVPNFANEAHVESKEIEDYWLYVGRLSAEKGILRLIQNWPINENLHIVGAGPSSNAVTDSISPFPQTFTYLGQLPSDDVRSRIKHAKGLIIPSLWREGIPTVALEALQLGTPILVSDLCSSATSLTEGGGGSTFDPYDSRTLKNALHKVKANRAEMSSMAKHVYDRRYSEKAWLRSIENIYHDVITGR